MICQNCKHSTVQGVKTIVHHLNLMRNFIYLVTRIVEKTKTKKELTGVSSPIVPVVHTCNKKY